MNMENKKIPLTFGFKGSRSYVQGPDLINGVLVRFPEKKENIKFTFHGMITVSRGVLSIHEERPESSDGQLRGSFSMGGRNLWIELKADEEETQEAVRAEYDESAITRNCLIDGNRVALGGESPYTFIETIVSMKKHLLSEMIPPGGRKWIFTGMEMGEYRDYREQLSVNILHNFQQKLVKSEVLVAGARVAIIYFSLVDL
jgi:hypothetical protein